MTHRVRRSLVALSISLMTAMTFVACTPGDAKAGPRSWLATETDSVAFLSIAIDDTGAATGSFSIDARLGGRDGIPAIEYSERYTVSGSGDSSGLVLRLADDAGGAGSATATYRGSDLDLAATLADGTRQAWLMQPANAADFDAALRAMRSPDVTAGATCTSPGRGFLYQIEQQSMERTLAPNETVLVVPRDSLGRGDIVVFDPPESWVQGGPRTPFIKRVVAIGGQTVEISRGSVRVDGVVLDEPYVYDGQATTASDEPARWVVPAGEVFVLGDHRAASADSRAFGPIAITAVLGVAVRRCLPVEAPLP